MEFTKEHLSLIEFKCPKCEKELNYHKGAPDFVTCPNYLKCGQRPFPAETLIMLLRAYIIQLKNS